MRERDVGMGMLMIQWEKILFKICDPRFLIRCKGPMLELDASDPIITTYLKGLQHLKDQDVVRELGLKVLSKIC